MFLGSVDPGRVPELGRLVDAVAARISPYRVVVERGGGRIRRTDGVAWLGLSEGAGTLIEIAADLTAACPPGINGGSASKRTPSAHLTLARKADEALLQALRTQACGPLGVTWRIDRIELVRSHLEPGGARYETLHQASL